MVHDGKEEGRGSKNDGGHTLPQLAWGGQGEVDVGKVRVRGVLECVESVRDVGECVEGGGCEGYWRLCGEWECVEGGGVSRAGIP